MSGNNENLPVLSVARHKEPINEFTEGLLAGNLDFKIICGEQQWPIHSEILKVHSGYFRILFENQFLESKNNSVDLGKQNLWDIARMIQFIYAGQYAADNFSAVGNKRDGRSMASAAHLTDVKNISELSNRRHRQQIHHAMFAVGEYFDIPMLQELVAHNLIDDLLPRGRAHPLYDERIERAYLNFLLDLEGYTRDFVEVHNFLLPYIDRGGGEKDHVEYRLVDHVLFLKFRALSRHKTARPDIPLTRHMRELDGDNKDNELVKHFNSAIRGCALKNARFALKIAERFEYCLDANALPLRWRFDTWAAIKEYGRSG